MELTQNNLQARYQLNLVMVMSKQHPLVLTINLVNGLTSGQRIKLKFSKLKLFLMPTKALIPFYGIRR
ncbi:hypothetical protein APC42_00025 [Acinetobacter pittii]|nr:hypothetical protein APC42_00025 [Acinetobacter pittii]